MTNSSMQSSNPPRKKLGSWRERLVKRALNLYCKDENRPKWLIDFRTSTIPEDEEGKDFVLNTDMGEIYIQVLSNHESMQTWWSKHRGRDHINRTCILRFGKDLQNQPHLIVNRLRFRLTQIRHKLRSSARSFNQNEIVKALHEMYGIPADAKIQDLISHCSCPKTCHHIPSEIIFQWKTSGE